MIEGHLQMVDAHLLEHFILNAVLFLLAGVRYFWGSPNDMLRLGLFLTLGWSVIGDMDYYYQWPLNLPSFGLGERETISKMLLITTFVIDLGRDYFRYRLLRRMKEITEYLR